MATSLLWKSVLATLTAHGHCPVRNTRVVCSIWRKFSSSSTRGDKDVSLQKPDEKAKRDPFPIFSNQQVQELLLRITGFDLLKVAGPQIKPLQSPVYKLLTDEQLAKDLQDARDRLKGRLQMPPYMKAQDIDLHPLRVDPDLAGFDTSSYVFTDISFGIKARHQSIVIREPDGTLRIALPDVRRRMNQIYSPREGREYILPKMFQEHNLERMISEKRYVYILNRACCQFEPDEPDFIRVTHRVYNAVDVNHDYELLRSTRHFGLLAFYLAWNSNIDFLLLDMMNRDLASDAEDVISLYCIIHPESPTAIAINQLDVKEPSEVIKVYIENEAKQKARLELALQAMKDAKKTKEKKSFTS